MKKSTLPTPSGRVSRSAVLRLLLLLVATVGFLLLYYIIPRLGFLYMPHIYLLVGGGLALWFVIYNRGFNTKGKTPDMLPDEIPLSRREEMIREGEARLSRSRWALYVILPLLVTLLVDMIYLFVIPEGLLP